MYVAQLAERVQDTEAGAEGDSEAGLDVAAELKAEDGLAEPLAVEESEPELWV